MKAFSLALASCLGMAAIAACAVAVPAVAPLSAFVAVVFLVALGLSLVSASHANYGGHVGPRSNAPRWVRVLGFRVLLAAAYAREKLGAFFLACNTQVGATLYAFQSAVAADIGFGLVGTPFLAGPYRAEPGTIVHATAANIVIGRWFTQAADGTWRPGGAGAVQGLFVNPQAMASLGTSGGGSLAPTLVVPTNTIGEFAYMGQFVVSCTNAVALGAAAWYDTTTGAIGSGAPGAGQAAIPNGRFIRQANAAAGLAVLELTN